jgi:hypothetical protein
MSECRSCHAEITWAVTTAGKRMPLDNRPTPDGTVVIDPDGRARVLARADLQFARLRFTPHWATCPNADAHRRPR